MNAPQSSEKGVSVRHAACQCFHEGCQFGALEHSRGRVKEARRAATLSNGAT